MRERGAEQQSLHSAQCTVMNARTSLTLSTECKCASSLANGIYFHNNYCMANNRWGILSSALNRIALHCTAYTARLHHFYSVSLSIRVRLFPCHSVCL